MVTSSHSLKVPGDPGEGTPQAGEEGANMRLLNRRKIAAESP